MMALENKKMISVSQIPLKNKKDLIIVTNYF